MNPRPLFLFGTLLLVWAVCAAGVAGKAGAPATDAKGRPLPTFPNKPLPKRTVASGLFKPSWKSLAENYKCPDWFRDAKFGMWAHWSAQCQPECGDWYARNMYISTHDKDQYADHLKKYGHPTKSGFKDIDNAWRAENWDPEKLMAFYKAAGAKYFVALANHHDNFDCYDSTFQEWNSVKVGPQKDIVGAWEKAARAAGLRFGVSNHSSRTWFWFQSAYGYDPKGPKAGVRYDGWLTQADGKGKWWEGLDPQELYGGPFLVPPDGIKTAQGMETWHTQNFIDGNVPPPHDPYYTDKWYLRAQELVNKYRPDLFYLDDTELPLGRAGLDIAADYYNSNMANHGGRLEAVLTCKRVKTEHLRAVVEDCERGGAADIQPLPWQTCSCIGNWHYDRGLFKRHGYKSVKQVVHMLVDIVSKNGNLLLSIPLKGDGTLDSDEAEFLKGMARWMKVNQEALFGTRPWKSFGEGPHRTRRGAFSEKAIKYDARDVRFTTRKGTLYATVMAWPTDRQVLIRSLATVAGKKQNILQDVSLLGHGDKLDWKQEPDGLRVTVPAEQASDYTLTLKITGTRLAPAPFQEPSVPEHDWVIPKPKGTVYEAEKAALSGGADFGTDHDGYSGMGFVAGYYSGLGQKTEFKVAVEKEGKREAALRFSNAMGSDQTISLWVNDKFVKRLRFRNLADWDTWADLDLKLDLKQGDNAVALRKDEGDGCVNLDYLAVQP
jgi:alpha-L-fucosidase